MTAEPAMTPSGTGKSKDSPGAPGTLLFENDRVRIWELVLKPGEVSNWHDHADDHLLVVFSGAAIANLADGSTPETAGTFDVPDNVVWAVPGNSGPLEWPINMSPDRTLREIIIDLKDPAGTTVAHQPFAAVPLFRPDTESTTWTPSPDEFGA